ncbi:MAG TPA: exodeoxyribonuclease VII small subunit [bacterium]|nr:exodeoxyribonuclease VII small subunit [bacterium]
MTPDRHPNPPDASGLSFEEAFQQLRTIAAELEGDGLGLEEAVQCYEWAMALATRCQALLAEAESRVSMLQNGSYVNVEIEISD